MKKKPFDAKAWARAQTQRRGGQPCGICSNPEVAKACDDVGEVWAREHPPGVSYATIAKVLGEKFDYHCGHGSVRNHFAQHRPELYRRICGR